jgi:hypothetical protein
MATRIGALDMLNLQSDEKRCLIRGLMPVLDARFACRTPVSAAALRDPMLSNRQS